MMVDSLQRIFAEFDHALVFVVGLLTGAFIQYWRERLWFKIEAFEKTRHFSLHLDFFRSHSRSFRDSYVLD